MFYITFVSIKANLSVYCGKLKNFMQPKKLIEDELNVDPNATMRIPQSLQYKEIKSIGLSQDSR